MALLLDTHAFLWFIGNDPRLSASAVARIADPATQVWVSAASAWEIVIKLGTGKLTLDKPFSRLWPESITANELSVLDITPSHVLAVEGLPAYHRDPFDRLLIAQAIEENLELVSADAAIARYPVRCVW